MCSTVKASAVIKEATVSLEFAMMASNKAHNPLIKKTVTDGMIMAGTG